MTPPEPLPPGIVHISTPLAAVIDRLDDRLSERPGPFTPVRVAAELADIDPDELEDLIASGAVPVERIGGRRYVDLGVVERAARGVSR